MCAIAGLYRLQGTCGPDEQARVRRLVEMQAHRGPDGEGFFLSPRAVLGHRRLSVIDPSNAGRQPMGSPNARLQVVFNGEIYNYQALMQELTRLGHKFRSRCDTEVLLHGYAEWGIEKLLGRLQGIFAFAVFDDTDLRKAPALLLARDRFGIKPLYYAMDSQRLVFGSEVRALESTGLFGTTPSSLALVRFLEWGSIPGSMTTVSGLQALPPGTFLRVQGSASRTQSFVSKESATAPSAPGDVRALVEDAVGAQLVSDVPVGVFLSGGIDSSLLVALASRRTSVPLRTVSVGFEESAFDESAVAKSVSDRYKTRHHETRVRRGGFLKELPEIFDAMDQPTIDGVNTYFVSKAARSAGLKVVLSGLGADELFGGYSHFQQLPALFTWVKRLAKLPKAWQSPALALAIRVAQWRGRPGAAKLRSLENPTEQSIYRMFRGLFTLDEVQALLGASDADRRGWAESKDGTPLSTLDSLVDRFTDLEFSHYLHDQLLRDTDVMSMHHSVEARVPFLDEKLVAAARSIPFAQKVSPGMPKPLLVQQFAKELPPEVWKRPKQGFTFPMNEWMRSGADELEQMACDGTPLDVGAVRKLWREFRAGQTHWSRAWATVVLPRYLEARRRLDRNAVERMSGAVA